MTVPAFIVRNLTQLAILSSTVDGRKSFLQKSLSGLALKPFFFVVAFLRRVVVTGIMSITNS